MSARRPPEVDLDPLTAVFFMAWRTLASAADAVLAPEGLGRLHHRILYAVARLPSVSVGDLAGALGITRQALHRPLAELKERGLVRVDVVKENRRERALTVTPKGKKLEDRATSAQQDEIARAFASVSEAEARGWVRVQFALAEPSLGESPELAARMIRGAT